MFKYAIRINTVRVPKGSKIMFCYPALGNHSCELILPWFSHKTNFTCTTSDFQFVL